MIGTYLTDISQADVVEQNLGVCSRIEPSSPLHTCRQPTRWGQRTRKRRFLKSPPVGSKWRRGAKPVRDGHQIFQRQLVRIRCNRCTDSESSRNACWMVSVDLAGPAPFPQGRLFPDGSPPHLDLLWLPGNHISHPGTVNGEASL